MKALRFFEYGDPKQVLHVDELPTPKSSGDSSALIEIVAAGINPSDVKNVQGMQLHSSVPRTPGRDFSGIVAAGPSEWLGKEVWGTGGDVGFSRDGSHAQYIEVPKIALTAKPPALSHEEAGTSALTFITAYLCFLAGTSGGETGHAVVIGAAGGVGNAAMQICRSNGLDAIGLVRKTSDADSLKEFGFKAFATDVLEPTAALGSYGLSGADIVIDTVGGSMFNVALSILSQRGRIVEIASPAKQRTVSFDMIDFYHREATLTGVDTRSYGVEACASLLKQLSDVFDKGVDRTQPVIQVSLDNAIDAYGQLADGKSKGRFAVCPQM